MKKIIFIALIYFSALQLYAQQDNSITIAIKMPRFQYVVGEEVFLELTYKNNTDSVLDYSISSAYENFDVIKRSGEKMPFRGNYIFGSEIELLKPNEEKKFFINLLDNFAPWGKYTQMYRAFSPGTYEVIAFLNDVKLKKYSVSNIITFEVIEPDSAQSTEFKDLKRMYRIEAKTFSHSSVYYRSFLLKYPTSIYSHRVIRQLFIRGDSIVSDEHRGLVWDAMNIIYKNPDSYSIYYPIKYIATAFGWIEHDHDKAYKFLTDIYERFKGHRASEEALKYRDSNYFSFSH